MIAPSSRMATMASSSLFRRHRNRAAEENDVSPAPPPLGSGDGGGGASTSPGSDGGAPEPPQHMSNNDDGGASSSHAPPPAEDEEQELIVRIPTAHNASHPSSPTAASPFVLPNVAWEPSEESTALRREAIHREVRRVQRANFVHFLVLCLVPTALLLIVIAAIVGEDGECGTMETGLTVCEREPRSFVNAFTSRCICEAIKGDKALEEDVEGYIDAGGDGGV